MNRNIEIGQVLSLKIRFNNEGGISSFKHPYLVVDIDNQLNVVEIAQIDSLEGKEWKAFRRTNKVIYQENPTETVIDKNSYVQLDNTLKIENFDELKQFRRQTDKLSPVKLEKVLSAYRLYHETNEIDEMKNVYMDKSEILLLNKNSIR